MELQRVNFTISGQSISALTAGDPSQKVALFLHGIPANALLWEKVLLPISQSGWYVVAPDCPGYGNTSIKNKSYYTLSTL